MTFRFVSILLFFCTTTAFACEDYVYKGTEFTIVGNATNNDGELIYTELLKKDVINGAKTLTVDYALPDGSKIANKKVEFNCGLTAPSFLLNDWASGMREGARWLGDQMETVSGEKTSTIAVPEGPVIVDAGFDDAININWDKLISGESLKFSYLFPRQGKFMKLRFSLSEAPPELPFVPSADTVFFKIGANNMIFRMLSSPIYVGYDRSSRLLKYYIGPSNLPTMKDQKNITISYQKVEPLG